MVCVSNGIAASFHQAYFFGRKLFPDHSIQGRKGNFASVISVLLIKEFTAGHLAEIAQVANPVFIHRACSMAGLCPRNHPGDALQVDIDRSKERFSTAEPY